jgi:Tfp pilus assembly major pilin PilA
MSDVLFVPGRWNVAPAGELLREPVRDLRYLMPFHQAEWLRKKFDHILLMAGGKSSYLSAKVKNEVLGATAFSAPANTYWGLWTTAAATDMDAYHGGTAGEVSGGSYDRVTKTNNTTNFADVVGDAAKVNSNAITWTTASANWNSGSTIPQLGIFDGNAKTSGDNLLLWSDFTTAKSVLNGDTAQINTSSFSWTEE